MFVPLIPRLLQKFVVVDGGSGRGGSSFFLSRIIIHNFFPFNSFALITLLSPN